MQYLLSALALVFFLLLSCSVSVDIVIVHCQTEDRDNCRLGSCGCDWNWIRPHPQISDLITRLSPVTVCACMLCDCDMMFTEQVMDVIYELWAPWICVTMKPTGNFQNFRNVTALSLFQQTGRCFLTCTVWLMAVWSHCTARSSVGNRISCVLTEEGGAASLWATFDHTVMDSSQKSHGADVSVAFLFSSRPSRGKKKLFCQVCAEETLWWFREYKKLHRS